MIVCAVEVPLCNGGVSRRTSLPATVVSLRAISNVVFDLMPESMKDEFHSYILHANTCICSALGWTHAKEAHGLAMIVGVVPSLVVYLSWDGVSIHP